MPTPRGSIAEKVSRAYGKRCPCCGEIMHLPPNWNKHSGFNRTRAHIHARGNPKRRDGEWFYGCARCNHDQGHLSLDEWWLILAYRQDARQTHVSALMELLGGRAGLCQGKAQAFLSRVERAAHDALRELDQAEAA